MRYHLSFLLLFIVVWAFRGGDVVMAGSVLEELAGDRGRSVRERGERGERVKRELLVLFGNDARELADDRGWPHDTESARKLQTPLEWMGYELRYRNLLKEGAIGREELSRYGGLVVDGALHVPEVVEELALRAIESARSLRIPVLFVGAFPFSGRDMVRRVAEVLELRGDGGVLVSPQTAGIVSLDPEMMNHEVEVRPRAVPTLDLRAPEGAEVFLAVVARAASGEAAYFDPVYLAEWGGALLDPYVQFQPSAKQTLLQVDLYKFLDRIWPAGRFPAPDPTTRDGLRVFFSHVDGDGFASLSHLRGGATCGEIILERILRKYPFPVTVSVVEANIRGLEQGQDPATREHLEEVAREVFALPHVAAATHTFSHPFVWLDSDVPYEEQYTSRNLELHASARYTGIDLEREVAGSAAYVGSLLPEGKGIDLVLWSGNCLPGPDALRIAREHGLENMNGGDTVLCRRYPGIAGVAPRVMQWDDELQVLAPNQNDFVYTRDWQGTSLTGFAEVLETFDLTESPRRLKPVNVYYHFYSGALLGPLSALDRVHQWCMGQPLHPVTASEFARITRDSRATEVFRLGERCWRMVNDGHLRTFRLPVSAGVAEMGKCRGITGYCRLGGWRYFHADGSGDVELQLCDPEAAGYHLFLETSDAGIAFSELAADSARFVQVALREITTVIGGARPGREYLIEVDGESSTASASADGRLTLHLPRTCTVAVTVVERR